MARLTQTCIELSGSTSAFETGLLVAAAVGPGPLVMAQCVTRRSCDEQVHQVPVGPEQVVVEVMKQPRKKAKKMKKTIKRRHTG